MKPHVITDNQGNRFYFLLGVLHREDGPAVELTDGTQRFFLCGKEIAASGTEEYLWMAELYHMASYKLIHCDHCKQLMALLKLEKAVQFWCQSCAQKQLLSIKEIG